MDNKQAHAGVTGTHTHNGMPKTYTSITPFIVVNNPGQAIEFYETTFGAVAKSVTEVGEGDRKMIIHADIDFGTGYLQLGAVNPDYHLVSPPGEGNACYSLGIYVPDVDQTLAVAVANGAVVREPAADFVSGDRFCSILDPFGIRWSIMTRTQDISEEESFRRVAEWSSSLGQ
ncbi:VOC family protein [Paenibacillus lemnae]|uniref:VOC family protein n=1 Tax=Paenibacillus lemnae TaxID=1330551 RepID=A0A848M2P1_PAELE|nr:VOC family protein [Paenibacillus lemnae]NMO94392.1 VOC family protein [Paenibacillus lemnae]